MTQGSTAPPPPQRDRGTFVMTMIVLAALLFVATAALLYYRWSSTHEPNCVLVVDAAPALRGAQITVDGIMLPQSHKATVGDNDRYSSVFYLDPGNYTIKVTLRDEEQFKGELSFVRPYEGKEIDLRQIKPTTAPITPPPATAS